MLRDDGTQEEYSEFLNKVYGDIDEMYRVFDAHRLHAINKGIRKVFILDKTEREYKINSFEANEPPPKVSKLLGCNAQNREQYRYQVAVVPVDIVLKYPVIPFCHKLNGLHYHFQDSSHLGLKVFDSGDGIVNTHLTFHDKSIQLAYSKIEDKPTQVHTIGIPYDVYYYWKKLYDGGIQTKLF